jgi:hypothetical protein
VASDMHGIRSALIPRREGLLAMIRGRGVMRPDIDPTVVRTTRAWWTPICSCSWTAAKFRNADAARRTAVRHAMSAGADGGYKHRVAVDVEREVAVIVVASAAVIFSAFA